MVELYWSIFIWVGPFLPDGILQVGISCPEAVENCDNLVNPAGIPRVMFFTSRFIISFDWFHLMLRLLFPAIEKYDTWTKV